MTAEVREKPRVGWVWLPVQQRAIDAMTPAQVVTEYVPVIQQAAAKSGGRPTGTPELFSRDKLAVLLGRDPGELATGSIYLVCRMVPADEGVPGLTYLHLPRHVRRRLARSQRRPR